MLRNAVIAGVLILAAAPSARATRFWSGNELLRYCEGTALERARCLGYIAGAVDSDENERYHRQMPACVPPGIEIEQVRDLVVDYLHAHPEYRSDFGSIFVLIATTNAWGCNRVTK